MLDEQKVGIKFRFQSYKIIKFEYNEPEGIQDKIQIHFNFNSRIDIDIDKDIISVTIGVDAFTNTEKSSKRVGFIEVQYVFQVLNLKDFQKNNDGFSLPTPFLTTLIGLSLSTTRGIILIKFSGTILEKIIMPVIDPNKLIPEEWQKGDRKTKNLKRTKSKR